MQTIRLDRDEAALAEAARLGRDARHPAALTGAGISVESGIPDFRSPGGLWSVFRPEEYATLSVFRRDPEKAWELYRALARTLIGAKPNAAHRALARLEAAGRLDLLVTQNVDGLHQAAGSRNVVEIHGDHGHLQCLACGHLERAAEERVFAPRPPRCPSCGEPLKPNVVLFEEPVRGLDRVEAGLRTCDLLLVVGTSAQVYPAAALPGIVRSRGGLIFEFNLEETGLRPSQFFPGQAGRTLERFVGAVLNG